MTIDMHAHFVPAQMAEALRQRREAPWIEAMSGGADRIVMGTDCPIFSTDWTLAAIRGARIDDADRQAILHGNAEQLLER